MTARIRLPPAALLVVLLASCGGRAPRLVDVCRGATGIRFFPAQPNEGPFAMCACDGPSAIVFMGVSLRTGEDACSALDDPTATAALWARTVEGAGGSCGSDFKPGNSLLGDRPECAP